MEGETLDFVEVATESDVSEGEMRAVELNGRRVLVARVEGAFYALGAICTHERAHLDEGTLMGHELYCPLHFSCFDVRTGEAVAPPADRATPVYAVKSEGGKILVSTSPVDPDSLSAVGTGTESSGEAREETPEEEGAEAVTATAEVPGAAETPPGDAVQPGVPAAGPAETAPGVAVIPPAPLHRRLIHRIEEMGWLESASEGFGAALRPLREGRSGRRIFDLLHGRITGHALHPALSDLPIGLWVGAVLLDIFGEPDAAGILVVGGVVAALATAATGIADWSVADGRDRRVGLMHGIVQMVALAVVIASLVARYADALLLGQLLLAAGLVLTISSAYLGGHLVLGRGVMVDRTAWTLGPRQWTRALRANELEDGETKAVQLENRKVLVSRSDAAISAIEETCAHAGGPLSMGTIGDGTVTCPWHLSCFRLRDGAVLRGPATHPQPMLEVRVRDGWIELRGRKL